MCVISWSGRFKVLRGLVSCQAEPRAWTGHPQAIPWDRITGDFRPVRPLGGEDFLDPNQNFPGHSEVTVTVTDASDSWKSVAMPSCRKRSLMRYTMKLLEKSRGNKMIPTSASETPHLLGWTDMSREPSLWSNAYIILYSSVFCCLICFCLLSKQVMLPLIESWSFKFASFSPFPLGCCPKTSAKPHSIDWLKGFEGTICRIYLCFEGLKLWFPDVSCTFSLNTWPILTLPTGKITANGQDTDSNGSHCAQRFTLFAPTRRSKSSLGSRETLW